MIGALVLAAAFAGTLPDGAARYRLEIGGEVVGACALSLRCAGETCRLRWETRLRLPRDAGGAVSVSAVELDVARDGGARAGPVHLLRDGERSTVDGGAGSVPVSLAEVAALAALRAGEPGCVRVFEEETGRRGRACPRADGAAVALDVLGVRERVAPGADGFPDEVAIPEQATRFVRDAEARVPAAAPALYGTRVPGPDDPAAAAYFCDVRRDPPAPAAAAGRLLPPPRAAGASCREKTAAYLAAARRAGIPGRTAVGVAWGGRAFVWHAWAELRVGGAWIPVDPSFGELPARGPRFTLGRWGEGDHAARLDAGRRILACWGRAAVLVP